MSSFKRLHDKDALTSVSKGGETGLDSQSFKSERLGELRAASYNSGEAICQFVECMNDTISTGEAVSYGDSDATTYKVEAAASGSNSVRAAGVALASAAVGEGLWIQKTGPNLVKVKTDNSVSSDSLLYKGSTNAGVVVNDADVADLPVGRALQGDGSNSQLAQGEAILEFPLG